MSSADKLTIETPEQTLLEFRLAGIGSRFLALAADTVIQVSAALVALAAVETVYPLARVSGSLSQWMLAAAVFAAFFLYEGYFAFFEAVWNGQTPGKRLARLRVIKDDGRPIGVYDAIARNLLRIVDQIPGIYAIGVVVMLFSKQSKRLGDYVAGTVVVHEQALEAARPFAETGAAAEAAALDTSRISVEEFQLLEAFLQRRDSLESGVRRDLATQIARRLGTKLGVEAPAWPACERFLEAIFEQARAKGLRG